jgi:hypothetical protein
MKLASLMQMLSQQAQCLNELALADPLLEAAVAGLVRRILRRHLGPLRATAENPFFGTIGLAAIAANP